MESWNHLIILELLWNHGIVMELLWSYDGTIMELLFNNYYHGIRGIVRE